MLKLSNFIDLNYLTLRFYAFFLLSLHAILSASSHYKYRQHTTNVLHQCITDYIY